MSDQLMTPLRHTAALPLRVSVRSFSGRADQVRYARAFVTGLMEGFPTCDDTVLLVSELAANACAHSASGQPGGTFVVRVQVSGSGRVYAEVQDDGSAWDGSFGGRQRPHGLYLLRALSTECGTRRGDRGWITWFVLDRQHRLSPYYGVTGIVEGNTRAHDLRSWHQSGYCPRDRSPDIGVSG